MVWSPFRPTGLTGGTNEALKHAAKAVAAGLDIAWLPTVFY